jgi:hypothetical protein
MDKTLNILQCGLKPALRVAFARRQPFFIWSSYFKPNKSKNQMNIQESASMQTANYKKAPFKSPDSKGAFL